MNALKKQENSTNFDLPTFQPQRREQEEIAKKIGQILMLHVPLIWFSS